MHEIHITNSVEKKQCLRLFEAIENYGGRIIDPEDKEQINYHMDQMYIDFMINKQVITLHWEHYTGIYLLSETADEDSLAKIWEGIKPLIR